jgi:cyclic beta-1,2-glucan synthetase
MPVESSRRFGSPYHARPRTQLLSNGSYSLMLTAAGSGYSRWRDIALTRWREDPTCDPWGYYIFLRDVFNGHVWSAGYQPIGRESEFYEAAFFEDRAEFRRKDGPIRTVMEIFVCSEEDAEVRHVSLTNEGSGVREIELTSYSEAVLSPPAADAAHPAFSKMFVQTEFVASCGALLATRRPREPQQEQPWMVHFTSLEGEAIGGLQFETDRARFIGRGHDVRNAVSIMDAGPLSNTVGTVLDPVLALRRRVRIDPGETVHAAFWTGIGADRAKALSLVDKLGSEAAFQHAKPLCRARAEVQLRDLGLSCEESQLFQEIAARILYADPSLRPSCELLARNQLGQSDLWKHGVSGDLPIVLCRLEGQGGAPAVKQLLQAQRYWQSKCLEADLVILNAAAPAAAAAVQTEVDSLIQIAAKLTNASHGRQAGQARGKVIALRADAMPAEQQDFLQIAARAVFTGNAGLREQSARTEEPPGAARLRRENSGEVLRTRAPDLAHGLEYFNGLGGFDAGAREYAVVLDDGQWTPAPWINVIANPHFGCLVSADAAGSSWSLNAQQNQITPWSNDPVSDTPAEAIYLRDEDSGRLWSVTPLPIRERSSLYVVRHGFGYTRTEHTAHGIALNLTQFVPLEDPVKISRLKIVNASDRPRHLSVTHYLNWMLGNQNNRAAPFIVTSIEPGTRALLARNPWTADFKSRVAFLDMAGRQQSCTADRTEFIGRHGSLAEPAALLGPQGLSDRVGGGLDPCGAMQTKLSLNAGEAVELTLLLGEESCADAALALIERYRNENLDAVFKGVTDFWDRTLGVLQVKTPDRSMDILTNGWLLYQTLGCRVWGRTAFYQSSGAYGYRDQLQDVMALCVSSPATAREHILRAASQQYAAGDVQHWWLPTSGQGIKTRVSDDRIWLAFVVAHYLEVTGDLKVLDEAVPFLSGGPLPPGTMEHFSAPPPAPPKPLFEHCVRALDSSLGLGSHGLPLFGTGDWNDGMNRVGILGRGESVWLAWFLYSALMRFAPIAAARGAQAAADAWRQHAAALKQAIEREAWDGDWYRRGYYDDGTVLGSATSDECRIDSVAQSWAVISGAAERGRAQRAMSAVDAQLVSRSDGLVKLFTPPFDHSAKDPGYIKAYPPGLRENGGQYTHAATWTILAFALLGDGDRAGELFALLNPINHAGTRASIHRYKVEPYVVCADLYSAPPHVGRGGWTWYTGSAGWMYRTAVEGILGIKLRSSTLIVDPCIPRGWAGFEFTYKFGTSRYRITVKNPQGVNRGIAQARVDGKDVSRAVPDEGGAACELQLIDDGRDHCGEITLG